MNSRPVLLSGLLVLSLSFSLVTPSLAAPKLGKATPGAKCSKLWSTAKAGSIRVQCADTPQGGVWVKLSPAPKTIASAMATMTQWQASIGLDGLADIQATVDGAQTVREAVGVAQQQRDELAKMISDGEGVVAARQAEIAGLPSRIQTAQAATKAAESALQAPKAEWQAAMAAVSSLSSAYNSAIANQYAEVGNQVLCMFGYRTCSSTSGSASSGYSATIAAYNSAKSREAGAYARYTSFFNDYKAKYDQWKALYDRQSQAQAEMNVASSGVQQARAALPSADGKLDSASQRLRKLEELTVHVANFNASTQDLMTRLTPEALQASPNWRQTFAEANVLMARHDMYRAWISKSWGEYVALVQTQASTTS